MISRSTVATAIAFVTILIVNAAALVAVDVIHLVPHFEVRQTCNHVGPASLVIVGVMSLAATVMIALSVKFWFYEPGKR